MCNDPKIYGPDEEMTEVIAKTDTLYPNGTLEVFIYSGVKMCLP